MHMIIVLIVLILLGSVVAGWIHGIVQWIREDRQTARDALRWNEEEA